MKHVITVTDGKRVQLLGFVEHPLVFDSYEAALEHAYEEWLDWPVIAGEPLLYECVPA